MARARQTVAAPPSGKALVVKTLIIDVYEMSTPGVSAFLAFAIGKADVCETGYTYLDLPGIGPFTIPFEPGLVVPAGYSLYGYQTGGVSARTTVTGYLVPASSVPATPAARSAPESGERPSPEPSTRRSLAARNLRSHPRHQGEGVGRISRHMGDHVPPPRRR